MIRWTESQSNERTLGEPGMFSLAQRCVALYKYIGEVKITEREELFKLKDSAGTKTNVYKWAGNKFSLEINIRFLKLSSSWISILTTSFSLALTMMKFFCCCYKVITLPVSVHLSPGISFSITSVVLLNLFVYSLKAIPPNPSVTSSIAPESNPVPVFSPAFELHRHHLLNFQRV